MSSLGKNNVKCTSLQTIVMRLALLTLMTTVPGCTSFGPGSVVKDRVDYSTSVAESWMRLTLLNIVKIRYVVPPVYMDVSSIVSGNSTETTINGSATFNSLPRTSDIFSLGATEKYTDRPTITYTPLTGSKFVKSILTPIPPEDLFSTIQSGWDAEAMLLTGANAINGLHNRQTSISGVSEGDKNFFLFLNLMTKLQLSDAVSMRNSDLSLNEKQHGKSTYLVFKSESISKETKDQIQQLKTLLRLKQNINEFRLVYGTSSTNDIEIAVQSRSLVQILGAMAAEIEVPPEHVLEGRTAPSPPSTSKSIIKIHCGKSSPNDALVSIPFRDHWFWIDDRDIPSKRAFNFIMILFALAETGELRIPLITIPAQS